MERPCSTVRVPCNNLQEFFVYWLKFLQPFHSLTIRELEVLACILKHRYILSKVISDEKVLGTVLFSDDTTKKMIEDLEMSAQYFKIILSKLKKVKIIVDNVVEPKFIPKLKEDNGMFTLLFVFDIKYE